MRPYPARAVESTVEVSRKSGRWMEEITMMYWGNGMGGWGMVLMTVSGLLFWGLIITGIVLLVRSLGGGGRPGAVAAQTLTPQQVLADRFARGEIDEDEYTQRLQVLVGAAPSARGTTG
ncbi:SHOCT domain-containing protein [Acrocarpospora sp. B8E8]|uniref:SHOCT domain-containing protein n=1 Tax=Acrocarpospora sp. B8E8 TaxID=3153572 RepID=UPI00325FD2CB